MESVRPLQRLPNLRAQSPTRTIGYTPGAELAALPPETAHSLSRWIMYAVL